MRQSHQKVYEELDISGKKYLKTLHGAKKLQYLWDYYKIIPILAGVCAFLIFTGFQMYRNASLDPYLDVVVLDAEPDKADALADYGAELSRILDPNLEYDTVSFDWSINTDTNDGEAVYREKLAVVVDQDVDLVVCGQDVQGEYRDEGLFADWTEVLGNDASYYAGYMTEGCLDLSKSTRWNSLGATYDTPCYLLMKNNSTRTEHVLAFVEYFFPTN